MVGKTLKSLRPGVVEKRLRMTLDFRVLIGELKEEGVGSDGGKNGEQGQDYVARQERLLRALLRDERVLAEFITYLVTDRVCGHADSDLVKVFGVRSQEEMLEPVYSAMGEEDARFFREAVEEGVFFESTEQMEWCFGVEWTGASLTEIEWEREGDTSAAEMEGHPDMGRFTK